MVLILQSVSFHTIRLVLILFWINFHSTLTLKRGFEPGLHIVGGVDSCESVYATVVTHYKRSKGWAWWKRTYSEKQYCGGVIIDKSAVLTAAHCVHVDDVGGFTGIVSPKYVTVYTGSLTKNLGDEKSTTVKSDVKTLEVPEGAQELSSMKGRDLALLILKEPLSFDSHRQSVELCNSSVEFDKAVHSMTVVGAGEMAHDKFPDRLQELEILSPGEDATKICAFYSDVENPETIVCFDGIGSNETNRKSVCSGDSGGPILLKTQRRPRRKLCVYGITSFGRSGPCETKRYYSVATKVGYYFTWIESVLNNTM